MVKLHQFIQEKKLTQSELLDKCYTSSPKWGSNVKQVVWEYKTKSHQELVKTWNVDEFHRYLETLQPDPPQPYKPIISVREKPCLHEQTITITVEMIDGPIESMKQSCVYCGETW
jgi:hypothetical protein